MNVLKFKRSSARMNRLFMVLACMVFVASVAFTVKERGSSAVSTQPDDKVLMQKSNHISIVALPAMSNPSPIVEGSCLAGDN